MTQRFDFHWLWDYFNLNFSWMIIRWLSKMMNFLISFISTISYLSYHLIFIIIIMKSKIIFSLNKSIFSKIHRDKSKIIKDIRKKLYIFTTNILNKLKSFININNYNIHIHLNIYSRELLKLKEKISKI